MGYVFNEFDKTLEMVEGAYKKLKAHLYFDKTLLFLKKRLALFESDREVFENKLKEEGHEIIFITARNPQEFVEPYKISYDFLKVNKVPYDKLLVNIQRKDQQCLAEGIDVFIDDNNDNCRAVHKVGVDTLQFGTLFTKKLKNIERVESWQEVYNYIQNKANNN